MSSPRRLTSAEVAAKLGVSVSWVYQLRSQSLRGHNTFPQPIDYDGPSPLYDEAAIEHFATSRAHREPSQRGRRPRTALPVDVDAASFADRLRAAIAAGKGLPDIPTQVALITRLGLNTVTFGQRMRGRVRWKAAELEVIKELLGIDVADANDAVERERAARRSNMQ